MEAHFQTLARLVVRNGETTDRRNPETTDGRNAETTDGRNATNGISLLSNIRVTGTGSDLDLANVAVYE